MTCVAKSNHCLEPYCSRFRRPKPSKAACAHPVPERNPMTDFKTTSAKVWTHAGLDCALRETPAFGSPYVEAGPYNGYVKVPPAHRYAGSHYDDVPVEIHGGLTFSETEEDGSTWFGWDDCHCFRLERSAEEETEDLARQLAALNYVAS